MVQVGTRKFTPPKDAPSGNVGRIRDPSGADELNGEIIPVPNSFPFLREIKNPGMVYPWTPAMAARSDLVEGYDPGTEREQKLAVEAVAARSHELTSDQIERMIKLQISAVDAFGQ